VVLGEKHTSDLTLDHFRTRCGESIEGDRLFPAESTTARWEEGSAVDAASMSHHR
jgi:hypothetical protein